MRLTIDGRAVELPEGATVLDGVNLLTIPLPQLCKDPDRAPLGACRTCLARVEGQRGLPAACHLPAREGMVVSTEHPDAVRVRRGVLDLTLAMLTPSAERADFAQVGAAAARHGLREPGFAPLHRFDVDASKSFFVLDREACILCGRCTVACDEVQQIGAIALLGRGHATKVGVFGDGALAASVCTSCGQCVATCPTGALSPKDAPARIARRVETTCPYCGVGCGLVVNVIAGESSEGRSPHLQTDDRLALMTDDVPSNQSSLGTLCVKGRFGTGFVHARDRVTHPMVRRDGRWVRVSWEEALDAAAASANHPVIAIRFRRAVARGARLVVVNPKRVDLCDQADLWLQQRPGTDVALFNAMARVILDEGLANLDFVGNRTEGFEAWRATLEPFTLAHAERVTGVRASDITRAARWYARPPFAGSCLIWGMGITQHTNGIHNAHAVLNLALVAGQMGFPGSGISPLRGQNNVQGCGDAGCIPTNLPGYQKYDPETLAKFEARWGVRPPGRPGRVVTEMIEGCLDGATRALYVVGENPLLSEPDLHHAEKAIDQLDVLVVQDLFMHETAERAHVFLPAAAFAEKEGTFTNSERRVQRVRQALPPPGEARPDWWIACELAKRVARRLGIDVGDQFDYPGPAEIFDEMARLTPLLAGLSHARLDREGGIQWPCPTADHPGTRYLYAESFPTGRARFVPARETAEAAELPDRDFPFVLNTGRLLYHWHGGTLTRRVQGLLELAPHLEVAIHPSDARRLGVNPGSRIRVASRRGELTGHAYVTEAVRPGAVFVPFVKLEESAANFLTNSAFDPSSKIPEYKVCAVRVERVPEEASAGRHSPPRPR